MDVLSRGALAQLDRSDQGVWLHLCAFSKTFNYDCTLGFSDNEVRIEDGDGVPVFSMFTRCTFRSNDRLTSYGCYEHSFLNFQEIKHRNIGENHVLCVSDLKTDWRESSAI